MTTESAAAPAWLLGRYFYLSSPGQCHSIVHAAAATRGSAMLTARGLHLQVAAWPDVLSLLILRSQLAPAWTGTYLLSDSVDGPPAVAAAYGYGRWLDDAPLPLRRSAPLLGSVTITAYDTRRRQLSGYFEVRAPEQPAPTGLAGATRPCLLRLAGEFTDLVVTGH